MTTDITIHRIYWDGNFASMFFSKQAKETLDDVIKLIGNTEAALDYIENHFDTLDECEGFFHDYSAEKIIEMIGLDVLMVEGEM